MKRTALILCALSFLSCGGDDGGDGREPGDGKTTDDRTKDAGTRDGGGSDSNDGGGSDSKLTADTNAKLVECGLYKKDDVPMGMVDDDYDRCSSRCVLASPCNQIVANACADETDDSTSFFQCIRECSLAPKDGFTCKDGTKIAHVLVCDGEPTCRGTAHEDEANCPPRCADSSAPDSQVGRCDGVKDCKDGSDEKGCRVCR